MTTLEKLQDIIVDQGIDLSSITPESRLKEDLGLDSLDIVELIMAIEEEWCIDVDDDVAYKEIITVSGTVDMIDRLNQEQNL
jgi:acyl carrier protein